MHILVTAAAVLATVAATAGFGLHRATRAMRSLYPRPLAGPGPAASLPAHTAGRLTAAVLLDPAGTEVSDFLLPYQLLAASEAFDVYAVAAEEQPATLTGGLDVVPDLSFDRFVHLPVDRADLVVVPHLVDPDPRVVDWLRVQAACGAVVLTICTGAAVAAAAGLLDGRPATTHWGDIGRLQRRYRQVEWVRGVRYVDNGDTASSAGITSGIDATLHMIRRLAGGAAMHRAAEAFGYTDLGYLDDPTVGQHRLEPADLVLPLMAAFGPRRSFGLLLEDGVDEAALAAVMDTYAATFAAQVLTISRDGAPVVSRHGLTLLARAGAHETSGLERVLLPAAFTVNGQASSPGRTLPYAAFGAALRDLAGLAGHPIARFAAKRLEHRDPSDARLAPAWPSTHLATQMTASSRRRAVARPWRRPRR